MASVTRIPKFGGELILPGDDAYDRSRAVWNGVVDRRPAAILRCASTEDVVAAVRFARESNLEIAVKCGGHSVLGLSVPNGGIMIDLSPMSDRRRRADPWRRNGLACPTVRALLRQRRRLHRRDRRWAHRARI
ncbi:MAG: FAD-dependent oxidoreductase [Chloroflexi bacterium]|nr:MAG: FAD-dependent oxidoreductase [Chloroflexota bacterium]